MSCETVNDVQRGTIQAVTYPESCHPTLVEEDENESSPETTEHGNQTNNEAHDQGRRNEVSECLHSEKAGEGVALHRLEDIVLSYIEHLRIVPSEFLNGGDDVLSDGAWQGDFAFGIRQKERVKDLFGGGSDVLPSDRVRRGVRIGLELSRRADGRAWAVLPGTAANRRVVMLAPILPQES
jgi:hypothetical protein